MIKKLVGLSAVVTLALVSSFAVAQPPRVLQRVHRVARMAPNSPARMMKMQRLRLRTTRVSVRVRRVRPMIRIPGMERIRFAHPRMASPVVRATHQRRQAAVHTAVDPSSRASNRVVRTDNERTYRFREHRIVDPIGAKRRKIRDKMKVAFILSRSVSKKFPGKGISRTLREDKKPEQN